MRVSNVMLMLNPFIALSASGLALCPVIGRLFGFLEAKMKGLTPFGFAL